MYGFSDEDASENTEDLNAEQLVYPEEKEEPQENGVYLGDGVWVDRRSYAIMRGKLGPSAFCSTEEHMDDLRKLVDAGLDVVLTPHGAHVEKRFFIPKDTRTYEARTFEGPRTYGFTDVSTLVTRLTGGEWIQSEAAVKSAEYRKRKGEREDAERGAAYEKVIARRIDDGGRLPPGGVGSSSPHAESGFHGVRWNNGAGKWGVLVLRPQVEGMAHLRVATRRVGFYDSPLEAALAFDVANIRLRGRFARTNFPPGSVLVRTGADEHVQAPDGSKLATVQPDDRAERLGISRSPSAPRWVEKRPEASRSLFPKRMRQKIEAMHSDLPDYSDLERYDGGTKVLETLMLSSIDELVKTMNDLRLRRIREPLSRREFPTNKPRFASLVREFKSHFRKTGGG